MWDPPAISSEAAGRSLSWHPVLLVGSWAWGHLHLVLLVGAPPAFEGAAWPWGRSGHTVFCTQLPVSVKTPSYTTWIIEQPKVEVTQSYGDLKMIQTLATDS